MANHSIHNLTCESKIKDDYKDTCIFFEDGNMSTECNHPDHGFQFKSWKESDGCQHKLSIRQAALLKKQHAAMHKVLKEISQDNPMANMLNVTTIVMLEAVLKAIGKGNDDA